MDKYIVDNNPQDSGQHEVHKEGCPYYPSDKTDLGVFLSCHGAVLKAMSYYTNINGCKHCCTSCYSE